METLSNATKIKNSIAFFLEMEKINFHILEDTDQRSLVQLYVKVKENTVNFYIDFHIERNMVVFVGQATQSIPLDRIEEVQLLLNYVNFEFIFPHNFFISPENGLLQCRSIITTDDLDDINLKSIRRHVYENLNGINYLIQNVMRIGYGDIPAAHIIEEMNSNSNEDPAF